MKCLKIVVVLFLGDLHIPFAVYMLRLIFIDFTPVRKDLGKRDDEGWL